MADLVEPVLFSFLGSELKFGPVVTKPVVVKQSVYRRVSLLDRVSGTVYDFHTCSLLLLFVVGHAEDKAEGHTESDPQADVVGGGSDCDSDARTECEAHCEAGVLVLFGGHESRLEAVCGIVFPLEGEISGRNEGMNDKELITEAQIESEARARFPELDPDYASMTYPAEAMRTYNRSAFASGARWAAALAAVSDTAGSASAATLTVSDDGGHSGDDDRGGGEDSPEDEGCSHQATVAATPSKPTAKVVSVSYETSASCSHGVCPSGCSHLMWECKACSCEGGWGAPRERLEELAAEHVCVAVAPEPVDRDEPTERTSNYGWAIWHLTQAKRAHSVTNAQMHATCAAARAQLQVACEMGATRGVDPNGPTEWQEGWA